MDIEKLEIARFGCLRDVHVDELGPGVHVFHGTNETGKTTLLEFVRGMLFGFGSLARRGVIESNVENAGSLVVRPVVDGRQWKVLRRRAAGTPLVGKTAHDELQIEDEAGRQHVRTSLEEWTGGLDEASYIAVMAFGLDELHELSSLQSAGCGGRLYELAGGLDRGHVFRVMENLRGAIERADSHDP
ncbi:MAG: ATP-binding protein [Pirellulales bacterium]